VNRWLLAFVAVLVGAWPVFADVPEPAVRPVAGAVLDLNQASHQELCTLPGVGPKKAQAIIDLRTRRPFTRVTQLLEVRGIGKKSLEKLKPRVRVTPRPPALLPVPILPGQS